MLKPKKRKIRTHVTLREHAFVVYDMNNKARVLPTEVANDLIAAGLEHGRFREAPYVMRRVALLARARFIKATVGVVGLRAMPHDQWDSYWSRKNPQRVEYASLTSEARRQTSTPTSETIKEILSKPRQIDSLVGWDAGLQEPAMGKLFQNGIGGSPRIPMHERKSDIEMSIAMQQGPDAVRDLYLQRYGVKGPNGEVYLLDTEYYDHERSAALLRMVLGSESNEEVNDATVRTFRKGLNHGKVGAFGDNPWRPNVKGVEGFVKPSELHTLQGTEPQGRPPLTMAREYAMFGAWGSPKDDADVEPFNGEIKGVELRKGSVTLHNLELSDVDPFSEELTAEQKAAILEEAKINPLYFYKIVMQAKSSAWTDARFPFTAEEVNQITELQRLASKHEYQPQDLTTTTKHYFTHLHPKDLFAVSKPEDNKE